MLAVRETVKERLDVHFIESPFHFSLLQREPVAVLRQSLPVVHERGP